MDLDGPLFESRARSAGYVDWMKSFDRDALAMKCYVSFDRFLRDVATQSGDAMIDLALSDLDLFLLQRDNLLVDGCSGEGCGGWCDRHGYAAKPLLALCLPAELTRP
jgi:hypothetical protein